MRILIEAHHPAHVHFWKYPIRELQEAGHEVLLIGRDRDVMRRLLEVYDWIPAEIPERQSENNRFPLIEMLKRQWTVACAIRRFKPDVVASLMGSYTQSAKLLGVRNIIFTDSEFQHFNHRIAHPFADEIYTPECFYKDLGPKQIKYNGIHELMFLNDRNFKADQTVLARYGNLEPGGYIVIRMSAWNTLHDLFAAGIGEELQAFVQQFRHRYKILISAEENCDVGDLDVLPVTIAAEDFHDLIYFSAFVLTEGASTASEAACLGVPTVYINNTEQRGYLQMLEEDYSIVRRFEIGSEGICFARNWLSKLKPTDWQARSLMRQKLQAACNEGSEYVLQVLLKSAAKGGQNA